MDRQDLFATEQVGLVDHDLAVEAAGAQQRRVEDVGPVRRGDQDDARPHIETVHLDQQLVQRLLALVVTTAHAGAPVPSDGVDLVHEDDRGGVGLGLLEQVTDARGTDTDEHLDEVGAGDREERHAGLAGDGAGEQGLAGPGRAEQQRALGDLGAHGLELLGALEEVLDLAQLLDGLVGAGDVGEGDLRRVLVDHLGLGLAELHDAAATPLHLLHEEEEQPEDQHEGQQVEQQADQRARLLRVEVDLDRAVLDQPGDLLAVDLLGVGGRERDGLAAVDELAGDLEAAQADLQRLALELLSLERSVTGQLEEPVERDLFGSEVAGDEVDRREQGDAQHDDPEQRAP